MGERFPTVTSKQLVCAIPTDAGRQYRCTLAMSAEATRKILADAELAVDDLHRP